MANTSVGALSVKITADTRGVKKGLKNTEKALKNSETALESNSKQWDSWSAKSTAATAALSVAIALTTAKIVDYSDSFTSITNKLKLATSGTEDLARTTESLFGIANETRASVESTVDLYTKMERATRKLDIGQSRLLKVTESINKAFAISGASTQEATGSIRQLAQALQSGTLRGDEFNSIAEGAPIIMEAVREATGKTAGELRDLAATGAITAEILIEALERYAKKIDTDFAQSTATFSQKLEIAKNEAIKFVGANEAMNDAVGIAGDGVLLLANNLDVVAKALAAVAVVIGSRMVGALTTATIAQVRLTIAQTAGITTTKVYNAATLSMATVTTRATIATRAATLATTGLKGAMALLGGPAGVITLAAVALAYYVTTETDAEKRTAETTKSIDEQIRALKDLGKTQRELAEKDLSNLTNKAFLLEEQIKSLNQASDTDPLFFVRQKLYRKWISDTKDELAEVNKQQAKYNELIAAIDKSKLDSLVDNVLSGASGKGEKPLIDLEQGAKDKAAKKAADKAAKAAEKIKELEKERTADFLAELNNRFSSAEELENARHKSEVERLRATFTEGAELTANQQKLLQELETQHQEAISEIKRRPEFQDELMQRFATETELENMFHEQEMERLRGTFLDKANLTATERELEKQLTSDHEKALTDIKKREEAVKLAITTSAIAAASQALLSGGKKAQSIGKKLAIANALIKGKEAAVSAWSAGMATGGPFAPVVAAAYTAASIARTAGLISSIKSGGSSGGGGGGSVSTPNGGNSSSAGGGGTQSGVQQQTPDRRVTLDLLGSPALVALIRDEIMPVMNEAIGDGVEFNVSGG